MKFIFDREPTSTCDLGFRMSPDKIKMNQLARYLGQLSFRLNVIAQAYTKPDRLLCLDH